MLRTLITTTALSLFALPALADSWTLDGAASHLAFGSIKNAYVGEVHSFGGLAGTAKDGQVEIKIDLASVETSIDIRNERMGEHVFGGVLEATLRAEVPMDDLSAMAVGDSQIMELDGALELLGEDVSLFTNVMVMRLTETKVMVMTNDMMFLATDEAGIDAGIDTLQELASLDSIARATPITARFIFDLDA